VTTRREFLRSVGLLAALPGLFPLIPAGEKFTKSGMQLLMEHMRRAHVEAYDGFYTMFVHPIIWRDVCEYEPRGRWEWAYRRYRVARQEGVCGYLEPRAIVERFAMKEMPIPMEVGQYESFRFIYPAEGHHGG
jgi:hypothetical protein